MDKLEISIDSWNEVEHDKFRRQTGSHKKCFDALSICKKLGMPAVITMTVIKNATKTESFSNMVSFAIQNKIPLIFSPAIPFGNWEDNLDIIITEEDTKTMADLHKKYPFLTRDIYNNMNRKGCPAFKQIIYITEYGDILPCAFCHISFGNIREKDIYSIRKKALKLKYFKEYHDCCLAAEDKAFIKNYLSANYSISDYPVRAEKIFKEYTDRET